MLSLITKYQFVFGYFYVWYIRVLTFPWNQHYIWGENNPMWIHFSGLNVIWNHISNSLNQILLCTSIGCNRRDCLLAFSLRLMWLICAVYDEYMWAAPINLVCLIFFTLYQLIHHSTSAFHNIVFNFLRSDDRWLCSWTRDLCLTWNHRIPLHEPWTPGDLSNCSET